jgi:beta-lactamase regulating signal transducer with metallopeptidase domain
MLAELLALTLIRAQIAAAAAVVLVLLVRIPARRLFGARLAYGLWAILPAAAAAAAFPSLAETLEVGAPAAPLGDDLALRLLLLWLTGCGVAAAIFAAQDRAFRRTAARGRAGPAVMGALWPQLVVPADFEQRFDARERDLILLHERTHIRRGDPIANLAMVATRVLGWCNPLIHIGARLARIDQELACDATVMALRRGIGGDYARTLLKAQMNARTSPLACGWTTHPLILRVSLLNRREPGLRREIAGFLSLTALGVGAFVAVWSLAPRGLDHYDLASRQEAETLYAAPAEPERVRP